jgi:catechol 2,3-dioxygenase-like lactoylglutathione lyase family enzyme
VPLTGVDHLAFTVSDLDRTTDWYCEHLGFQPLLRYANEAIGAEVQVLHHADLRARLSFRRFDAAASEPFSEFRVGLDHLALGVTDESDLGEWQDRLEDAGVLCGRTDLPELSILVFRDPDNIQIELCTPLRAVAGGGLPPTSEPQ